MKTITDEYMKEMLPKAKGYTFLLPRPGPRRTEPGSDKTIWEHGRRNFAMRAEGLMREDPAVKEGVLVYSLHAWRGVPGDALP